MDAKIAIQGIKGSFHQVAQEYYEHSVVVTSVCLWRIVNSLLSGRAEQAVMAIENSIAGLIPNYALIDKHNHI
jgi:prephenate dehydratase